MSLSVPHKIESIKKNNDIKNLMLEGDKIFTKYGIFFLNRDIKNNTFEFAVLIKKSVGKAVWRNYCKRLVREYMRAHIQIFTRYNNILFIYNYKGKIVGIEIISFSKKVSKSPDIKAIAV